MGAPHATDPTNIPRSELQVLLHDFLSSSSYRPPKTARDLDLRKRLASEIATWQVDIEPQMVGKMIETSCSYAETAYCHIPPEHRYYVALYTACMLYGEDLGERDHESVAQFARRLIRGERQLNPIFDRLVDLLKEAHMYWTDVGADAIITGTVDALSGTFVEFATASMVVAPSATRYPWYLRTRAGGGPQYTHFMFTRSWRETPDSYLQLLPEIEHWTLGTNDILSFYKEELAGETSNYVHLRAAAEQLSPLEVLRQLTAEVIDTAERIKSIIGADGELAELWETYLQRYLEFTIRTPRYRLGELGIFP
ncbi:terpenoid synthase [Polyporus arcularius HHB13444]|uniref:Terpenoid synthase n=1 Tax=Polyporus arcularius HHB13444 TaxID=1314778 RepID=A0A5C3P1G0_9APHY|nr:terpenoid synthase [Polyporus arcularius HHB13444]